MSIYDEILEDERKYKLETANRLIESASEELIYLNYSEDDPIVKEAISDMKKQANDTSKSYTPTAKTYGPRSRELFKSIKNRINKKRQMSDQEFVDQDPKEITSIVKNAVGMGVSMAVLTPIFGFLSYATIRFIKNTKDNKRRLALYQEYDSEIETMKAKIADIEKMDNPKRKDLDYKHRLVKTIAKYEQNLRKIEKVIGKQYRYSNDDNATDR